MSIKTLRKQTAENYFKELAKKSICRQTNEVVISVEYQANI